MWGGVLPPDWTSYDAEMYAIHAYLQAVMTASMDPAQERVLIVSDCRPALDAIESAWRRGNAALYLKDRGNILEGICNMRQAMDRVIFVWCPGHAGITPNEYADMVADAYQARPSVVETMDVTAAIANGTVARDIIS